jgi:hypothetical protein
VNTLRNTGVFCAWLAAAGAALAEDEPPYRWLVTGETVETLEVEFAPLFEVDQGSPEGVVTAYVALTDDRASAVTGQEAVRAAVEPAIRRSLEPFEAALLTPDARRALVQQLETAGAAPDPIQQTLAASEIRRVDRHGELAYVVTGQWVTTRELITAPDEWNVAEEYVSRLFTCTEIDGAWFIESAARWQPDPRSSADAPTEAWIPEMSPLTAIFASMLLTSMSEPPPSSPAKTAEEAARAVFDVFKLRSDQLERDSMLATMREPALLTASLLAPTTAAEVWRLAGEIAEGFDRDKPHLERRAIRTVELEVDEAVFTFEPSRSRAPAPVVPDEAIVRVQWNGDAWQIAAAGYYLKSFFGSTYVDTPFIYALR